VAFLGIDAGASATKWVLSDGLEIIASGKELAMDGHIYRGSTVTRMNEVLKEISSAIQGHRIDSVFAGITGYSTAGDDEATIHSIFQSYFPESKVKVIADMELAYLAELKPGAGILMYAGTGSIAVHMPINGPVVHVGGWGYLLGDEGAGFWIGREAIRVVLEALERGTTSPFVTSILKALDCIDWSDIRAAVYSQDRSFIASLTSTVAELGNKGDAEAIKILTGAADELEKLVHRTEDIVGGKELDVVFAGGVLNPDSIPFKVLKERFGNRAIAADENIAFRASQLALN
jgi:N-acetylglucosamine kinase-like BadF-type ATPase